MRSRRRESFLTFSSFSLFLLFFSPLSRFVVVLLPLRLVLCWRFGEEEKKKFFSDLASSRRRSWVYERASVLFGSFLSFLHRDVLFFPGRRWRRRRKEKKRREQRKPREGEKRTFLRDFRPWVQGGVQRDQSVVCLSLYFFGLLSLSLFRMWFSCIICLLLSSRKRRFLGVFLVLLPFFNGVLRLLNSSGLAPSSDGRKKGQERKRERKEGERERERTDGGKKERRKRDFRPRASSVTSAPRQRSGEEKNTRERREKKEERENSDRSGVGVLFLSVAARFCWADRWMPAPTIERDGDEEGKQLPATCLFFFFLSVFYSFFS